MKKIQLLSVITILAFLFSTTTIFAQEWQTDFKQAKVTAAESDRPVLLVFKGSDWCIPCMKLDKQILETDAFNAFAEDNLVLLKADFPRRKKNKKLQSEELVAQNKQLASQYNQQGVFPLVVLLNASGEVIAETGFEDVTPAVYIERLKEFLK